jgi:hypothetical protein
MVRDVMNSRQQAPHMGRPHDKLGACNARFLQLAHTILESLLPLSQLMRSGVTTTSDMTRRRRRRKRGGGKKLRRQNKTTVSSLSLLKDTVFFFLVLLHAVSNLARRARIDRRRIAADGGGGVDLLAHSAFNFNNCSRSVRLLFDNHHPVQKITA